MLIQYDEMHHRMNDRKLYTWRWIHEYPQYTYELVNYESIKGLYQNLYFRNMTQHSWRDVR